MAHRPHQPAQPTPSTEGKQYVKAGGLKMVLFLIFGACFLAVLFLGAIAIEGDEFLLFACGLILVSIIGSLIMMSLPNH